MNIPLGVSPSKGNQGTTRGKEKILLLCIVWSFVASLVNWYTRTEPP